MDSFSPRPVSFNVKRYFIPPSLSRVFKCLPSFFGNNSPCRNLIKSNVRDSASRQLARPSLHGDESSSSSLCSCSSYLNIAQCAMYTARTQLVVQVVLVVRSRDTRCRARNANYGGAARISPSSSSRLPIVSFACAQQACVFRIRLLLFKYHIVLLCRNFSFDRCAGWGRALVIYLERTNKINFYLLAQDRPCTLLLRIRLYSRSEAKQTPRSTGTGRTAGLVFTKRESLCPPLPSSPVCDSHTRPLIFSTILYRQLRSKRASQRA